jgi:hypothetical protein
MARWAFKCYAAPGSDLDEIRSWHDALRDKRARTKFFSRLRSLRTLPIQEWRLPLYRELHGDCAGLGEVRFDAGNVVYRILGFHLGANFVLVFPAEEKGGKLRPLSACETGLKRIAEIRQNPEIARDLDWLAFE